MKKVSKVFSSFLLQIPSCWVTTKLTNEQWIYAERRIATEWCTKKESNQSYNTEAEFSVPDWGDKVDYVIGLSYNARQSPIFRTFKEPKNRFQGINSPAEPGGPVRQPYTYSVPNPIDCLKIPA